MARYPGGRAQLSTVSGDALSRRVLAADFERNTLPADAPPVRFYIGSGTIVGSVALYAVVTDDGAVEVIWRLIG